MSDWFPSPVFVVTVLFLLPPHPFYKLKAQNRTYTDTPNLNYHYSTFHFPSQISHFSVSWRSQWLWSVSMPMRRWRHSSNRHSSCFFNNHLRLCLSASRITARRMFLLFGMSSPMKSGTFLSKILRSTSAISPSQFTSCSILQFSDGSLTAFNCISCILLSSEQSVWNFSSFQNF